MSVIVAGQEFKTLQQDMYVNGAKVMEVWANGEKVYPEVEPVVLEYPYVMKINGSLNLSYSHMCAPNASEPKTSHSYTVSAWISAVVFGNSPISLTQCEIPAGTSEDSLPGWGTGGNHFQVNRPAIQSNYLKCGSGAVSLIKMAGAASISGGFHPNYATGVAQTAYYTAESDTDSAIAAYSGLQTFQGGQNENESKALLPVVYRYAAYSDAFCGALFMAKVPYHLLVSGYGSGVDERRESWWTTAYVPLTDVVYTNFDRQTGEIIDPYPTIEDVTPDTGGV